MPISTYSEFIQQIKYYKIFPFSDLIPDHPSLTAMTEGSAWHTGTELDPWLWRVRVVKDEHAAYAKFFGSKLTFIQTELFPSVRALLAKGKSPQERYRDGMMSQHAINLYSIIAEAGTIDSRQLRKASGLTDKEQKKDYEKALVELQNFADIVITGAQEADFEGGWSSMCFESSEHWLQETLGRQADPQREPADIRAAVQEELSGVCSEKAMKYLGKKLGS